MVNAPNLTGFKVYDPEYRLYESFIEALSVFNPPEAQLNAEFTRPLASPYLLLRNQSERLANRIPE